MIKYILLAFWIINSIFHVAIGQQKDPTGQKLKGKIKSYKELFYEDGIIDNAGKELSSSGSKETYFNDLGIVVEERRHTVKKVFVSKDFIIKSKNGSKANAVIANKEDDSPYQVTNVTKSTLIKYSSKSDDKGNVIELKEYAEDGLLLSITTSIYNDSGKLIEERRKYTEDGMYFYFLTLQKNTVSKYDAVGNKIEDVFYDEVNLLEKKSIYSYDKSSKLKKTDFYYYNNVLVSSENCRYDSQKRLIAETVVYTLPVQSVKGVMPTMEFAPVKSAGGQVAKMPDSYYKEHKYDSIAYTYNEQGFLAAKNFFDDNRPVNQYLYIYNDSNQIVEENKKDLVFNVSRVYVCTYDVNGSMVSKGFLNSEGNVESSVLFVYDDKGRLEKELLIDGRDVQTGFKKLYYNEKGQNVASKLYRLNSARNNLDEEIRIKKYDSNDRLVSNLYVGNHRGPTKDSIVYDDKGRIMEEINYRNADKMIGRTTFKYNEQGDLVEMVKFKEHDAVVLTEEREYNKEENSVISNLTSYQGLSVHKGQIKYIYNSKHELLEIINPPNNTNKITANQYRYDSAGNLIEERIVYKDNPESLIAVIYYRYDAVGNLIQKDSLKDGEIVDRKKFEISYYN